MYYAVKISEETKQKILRVFTQFFDIPEGWKVYCDHITLIHSSHKDWDTGRRLLTNFERCLVTFYVTSIGRSENAYALGVALVSMNEVSHITIACKEGHKPVESNEIKVWEKLYCPEKFNGALTLCD